MTRDGSARLPADEGIREAIRTETARNVVVEASAGTGKTSLVVERVINLLGEGVPLDRMAVVTFTEAAASELRQRIRRRLLASASSGDRSPGRQAGMLQLSVIRTIHGFASTILKRYSHLTRVDPSFTVSPRHYTDRELLRRWDGYLAGLDDAVMRSSADALRLLGTDELLRIASDVESTYWIEDIGPFLDRRDPVQVFLAEAGPAVRFLESVEPLDPTDLLCEPRAVLLDVSAMLEERPPDDPLRLLGRVKALSLKGGRAASWGGRDDLGRVKEALRSLKSRLAETLSALAGSRILEQAWTVVWPFVESLRSAWTSDPSRLSYEDLLVRCAAALGEDRFLRESVDGDFRHILVDEFQDTSILQVRLLANLLAGSGNRFPPGRLTVVGDPKQSIYGWRNADMETYRSTVEALRGGDASIFTVTTNFRSTRRIVDFVNGFGRALFELAPADEAAFGCTYSPIEPHPGAEAGEKPLVLRSPPDLKAGEAVAMQAAWFARHVEQNCAGAGGAAFGDYALLLRSRNHMDVFVEALSRCGVPYRVEAGRDLKRRPEIIDLREMLRCLLSPGDRLAWIHTLRSAFFGCDDRDITRAVLDGCSGYLEELETAGTPESILRADRMLRRLRKEIVSRPLADFLPFLLFETDLLSVIAASGREVERRFGNLLFLVEEAVSGGIHDLEGMLELLELERTAPRLEEPSSTPPGGDAVIINTIHGAKGLDYARVVVAAIPRTQHRPGDGLHGLLAHEHSGRAAFRVCKDVWTPCGPDLERILRARERAETRRLYYVAVTRARERLYLLVDGSGSTREGSAGRIVAEALEKCMDEEGGGEGSIMVLETLPRVDLPERRPPTEVPGPPGTPGGEDGLTGEAPPAGPEAAAPPGGPGTGDAVRLGLLVHSILEKIDLDDPLGWLTSNAGRLEETYPGVAGEAAGLVRRFFEDVDHPFEISSATVIGREYPVFGLGTVRGGRGPWLFEAYIDLLVDTGEDGVAAVDYKTDDPSGVEGGLEGLVEKYRARQERYGRLLAEALQRPVTVILAFLRPARLVRVGRFHPEPTRQRTGRPGG